MWTPNLVTFKEEARATSGIYKIIYCFYRQSIYNFYKWIIIIKQLSASFKDGNNTKIYCWRR